MSQQVNIGGTIVTVYTIDDFPADANMGDANKFAYIKSGVMKSLSLANLKSIIAGIHYTKVEVDELLDTAAASSNFAPYDDTFTYIGGTTYYVSHVNKIYKFISANNHTGTDPGSDPAVWEITSQNEFTHEATYTGQILYKTAAFNVLTTASKYFYKGAGHNATFPGMSALKNKTIRFSNVGKFKVDGNLTFVPDGAEQFFVNGELVNTYDLPPGKSVEVAVDEDLTNIFITS